MSLKLFNKNKKK
jgi:ubiquitin-conjugating enzyme E2 M